MRDKTKVAPAKRSPERLEKYEVCLTNPGAQKPPVVLKTNLPAGEKIRHRRDGLSAATRARTHCQDEVTQ